MATKQETPTTAVPPLEMMDEEGRPLFFEEDGEILVRPGTVPSKTIIKEINEGVHHLN